MSTVGPGKEDSTPTTAKEDANAMEGSAKRVDERQGQRVHQRPDPVQRGEERSERHRLMTNACPSFDRLMRGAERGAFGPDELDHLSHPCGYCQFTLRLFFSYQCPSRRLFGRPRALGGALGAALDEHLAMPAEGGCQRCRKMSRSPWTAAVGVMGGGDRGVRAGRGAVSLPVRWTLSGVATLVIAILLVLTVLTVLPGGASGVEATPLTECRTTIDKRKANHVVVSAVWSKEERERFERVLQRFHEKTDIRVTFATADGDPDRQMGGTLRALAQQRCAPDVALLPQPGLLRNLAQEQKLQPVDSVVGDLVHQNYTPTWRELATVNESLYGVWFKASNKSMFWYNAKAFARARVEPPRDWEQLKRVAAQLQASGVAPLSLGGADGWTLTDWFENVYLSTAGPDKYDELSRHQIPWTDPTVRQALAKLAEIFGRPEWLPGGTDEALRTTYEISVERVYKNPDRPQAAMVFGADYISNEVARTKAEVGLDAKFFDFPTIQGSMPTVVGRDPISGGEAAGGDVAVMMTDREPGRELLRFLATAEAAEPWAKEGGFISPNKSVDPGVYPDEATREAARALVESETVRFDLSDLQPDSFGSTPGQGMWKIFQDFLREPSQVDLTAVRLERCRSAPVSEAATCHG